jgi:hypothetical protein
MPRPLSEVSLEEDELLLEGFEAVVHGARVTVTAVLAPACVYVTRAGERKLATRREPLVAPDALPIRRRRPGSARR